MPKKLRITIRELGYTVYARKRTTGKYNCSYEIRFNRNGFKISASGKTKEEAKKRFIEKAKIINEQKDDYATTVPNDFDGFAMYWFENFHKRKVIEKTYNNNLGTYNRHIKAKLDKYLLKDISPVMLQKLIEGLPGNGKTADDVHGILNQIFKTAVLHGKLKINPLDLFVHTQHDRESGIEFTRDEELKLLSTCKGTDYEVIFAILLYTGLRPNEYKTACIEDDFIVAVNSKRKTRKVEYKKIPICSHLRKYLAGIDKLPTRHEVNIRQKLQSIFPEHTTKDLRKTFNTRCIECKIDIFARKKYMGHSVGKLDATYTGKLDDFLLSEGKKLDDWYSLYPKITPQNDE